MTMEGMVQKHYMHRVPKEDNIEGPRINLTWRWIARHKPRCPATRTRSRPMVSDQSNVVGGSGMASNQSPSGQWRPIAPPHDGAAPAKQRSPATVPPPPPRPNVPKARAALHPETSQAGGGDGSEDRDVDRDPVEPMTSPKSKMWQPPRPNPNLLRPATSHIDACAIQAPQSKLGAAPKPMVVAPRPRS